MTLSFFGLPSNILSNIYEFDDTFRDIFKKQVIKNIWKRSFVHFKYNFLYQSFFQNKPILQAKMKTLLEYLFENEISTWFKYYWYDNQSEKPMPNDILITCHWNRYTFTYDNYKLNTICWYDGDVSMNHFGQEYNTVFVQVRLKYYAYPNNYTSVRFHSFSGNIISNDIPYNLHSEKQFHLYRHHDDHFTVIQYSGNYYPELQ
jgi:hypothetical protein